MTNVPAKKRIAMEIQTNPDNSDCYVLALQDFYSVAVVGKNQDLRVIIQHRASHVQFIATCPYFFLHYWRVVSDTNLILFCTFRHFGMNCML